MEVNYMIPEIIIAITIGLFGFPLLGKLSDLIVVLGREAHNYQMVSKN